MNYFYNVVVPEDERSRVELLEPFDEFEEWHLKCAHYILLTAFNGSCVHLASLVWPQILSHFAEINYYPSNVKSFNADCGTFVTVSKECRPSPGNAELVNCRADREVKEPASSDGTKSTSSKIEPNRSLILREITFRLLPSDSTTCKRGRHWKVAKLTFVDDKTDQRCQRFGHTANVLLINGRRRMVTVGGFGVASCGRHRRLADISVWDLSSLTSETYSVDSAGLGLLSRMCHATVTLENSALGSPALGNSSLVVVGGRHSPTSPVREHVVLVNFSDTLWTNSVACHTVVCSGNIPAPCWRHTVTHAVIDGMLVVLS